MRGLSLRFHLVLICICALSARICAQQEQFHWVDFHAQKDQAVVTWVTRTLDPYTWTAIREIGVIYDAALVVTTDRATPEASPARDTFQVWSVSLTQHTATPVLKGVDLEWLDWMQLAEGEPREMAAVYRDCNDCAATTYFTTFHYDMRQHLIVPRWMRGANAIPVWNGSSPEGVEVSQVYGVLADPNGTEFLAAWSHFDYGKKKDAEDYLYRWDVQPFSGLDRTQVVSGKDLAPMEKRLCAIDGEPPGMARGQTSALCEQLKPKATRRPVTTPPANNQGRSMPPGARPKKPRQ